MQTSAAEMLEPGVDCNQCSTPRLQNPAYDRMREGVGGWRFQGLEIEDMVCKLVSFRCQEIPLRAWLYDISLQVLEDTSETH